MKTTAERRRGAALAAILALLPAAFAGISAVTQAQTPVRSKRQQILDAMPKDPAVLVNVSYGDMPASPDILDLGKRATKALERCLADNVDDDARALCAVTLTAIGDKQALPTLHAALADWNPGVRYQVVRALGAMPDESSVQPLIDLYRRKDEVPYVRHGVIEALGKISDQRVVRLLRGELTKARDEDDEDPRPAIFDALWNSRHLMARTTLVGDTRAALRSDNDSLVQAATLAAAELRSPRLVDALIPLMEHQWPEVRNKAVYALGKIGDKKATKALLERLPKVRESRMLNNIAFALERLDKKAFYEAMPALVNHKQAVIRLNAAFVLGDVRHAEGLPMLEQALDDASDFVRTSAVVAVGKLGDTDASQRQRAQKSLERFVDAPALSVRQEAIYALHQLTEGGRADLIHDRLYKLDSRRHPDVVHRAAVALAQAGDPRVRDYALACLINHRCDKSDVGEYLRSKADDEIKRRMLLAWARGDRRMTGMLSDLKPQGSLPIAEATLEEAWGSPRSGATRSALHVLGSLGQAEALPLVQRRAGSEHTWARVHALVAAARLGDDGSIAKLVGELDLLPAEWLPDFVEAVVAIEEPAVRTKVVAALAPKEKAADVDIALAAAAIHLAWDPETAFFRFLDALASPSGHERDLAAHHLSRSHDRKVTFVMRRALAREGRESTRDRLRALLDARQ
ncbi:MAG: HEAT repeat domain-containing protein [Polyangiaceae bacterium]